MRVYETLSSWQLSVVLTLSGALYYGFLSIWSAKSPPHVVRNIAGLSPFVFLYVLLLTNTLLCIAHRLPTLLAQIRKGPVFLPLQHDWERVVDDFRPIHQEKLPGETGYLQVQHRFASLGTLLLHGALFFLAAGLLLTSVSRYEGKLFAAAGETLRVQETTFYHTSAPSAFGSSLPSFTLHVFDVKPEFWQDELLFTRLTSTVGIDDDHATVAINSPLFLSPGTSVRLTSFGYAPAYVLKAAGALLEEGVAKMRVFPPGAQDYFQSQHFPHRIYVKFYPDYQKAESGPISRSMNLNNPRFIVTIYRGKVLLAEQTLRFGEPCEFEGITLSLTGIVPMAEFTVTRDWGIPCIALAFVMVLAGLLLRVPGKRGERSVNQLPDGRWVMRGKNVPEPVE